MSTEDNKTIARRFFQEVWGEANLASLEELAAPSISVYYPYLENPVHGSEALKQVILEFHSHMSDHAQVSEDDIIAEDDKVVLCWTVSGTYTDAMEQRLGLPDVAGKQVVWTGMSLFHIVDGKVVEERGLEDFQPHMAQLGFVPSRPREV